MSEPRQDPTVEPTGGRCPIHPLHGVPCVVCATARQKPAADAGAGSGPLPSEFNTNELLDTLDAHIASVRALADYVRAVRGAAHFRECVEQLLIGTPFDKPAGYDVEGLYGRLRNAIHIAAERPDLAARIRALHKVHDGGTVAMNRVPCHYPGGDRPCDEPLHWWVRWSDLEALLGVASSAGSGKGQ